VEWNETKENRKVKTSKSLVEEEALGGMKKGIARMYPMRMGINEMRVPFRWFDLIRF